MFYEKVLQRHIMWNKNMPYIHSLGEWVDLFKHNICFILYSTEKKMGFSPNPSHDDQNTEESVDFATWLGLF